MKSFIALLLLSGAAFATQTCPVTIVKFFPISGPTGSEVYVQWKNTADKPTSGVRFGAYYISLGEKHDFVQMLEYNGPPKGSSAYEHPFKYKPYQSWYVLQNRTESGGVWVDKVVFRDGTSWQDDGSRSCAFERNK
jgi:hypothetical protein